MTCKPIGCENLQLTSRCHGVSITTQVSGCNICFQALDFSMDLLTVVRATLTRECDRNQNQVKDSAEEQRTRKIRARRAKQLGEIISDSPIISNASFSDRVLIL